MYVFIFYSNLGSCWFTGMQENAQQVDGAAKNFSSVPKKKVLASPLKSLTAKQPVGGF